MNNIYQNIVLIILLMVLTVICVGCGVEEMQSTWMDRQTLMSNIHNALQHNNPRHLIVKDEAAIEILNDEKTLLLRIYTRNRGLQRQFSAAGLTIWFDETGGKKKSYSLHFPRLTPQAPPESPQRDRGKRREKTGDTGPSIINKHSNIDNIEIVGPGENEHSRISAEDSSLYGIQYRTEIVDGYFVYAFNLPLIRNGAIPYGITLDRTKIIGIGLESSPRERSRVNTDSGDGGNRRGGGRQRGGQKGRGGGSGQGRSGEMGNTSEGGESRDDVQETMKPLSQWLKIRLAEKRGCR